MDRFRCSSCGRLWHPEDTVPGMLIGGIVGGTLSILLSLLIHQGG